MDHLSRNKNIPSDLGTLQSCLGQPLIVRDVHLMLATFFKKPLVVDGTGNKEIMTAKAVDLLEK